MRAVGWIKRNSRTATKGCMWVGSPHASDPTPVTLLTMGRSCGHEDNAAQPVATCARHLALVESDLGVGSVPSLCSVCGEVSRLFVVSRVSAR